MVVPLGLPQRKPYEPIIIGWIPPVSETPQNMKLEEPGMNTDLPRELVIISVPGKHSRKPQMDCMPSPNPISNLSSSH